MNKKTKFYLIAGAVFLLLLFFNITLAFLFLGVLLADSVNKNIKSGWALVLLFITPGIVSRLVLPLGPTIINDFFVGASFAAIIMGIGRLIKKKKK